MSQNTRNDVKTLAYVLRRTNFGEADRILNLITPNGKMSAIAKGVRKEKSKLAGGVEMFSLIELNIHQGKSELGTVTSARMLKYYGSLVTSLDRMELAAEILKKINRAAEGAVNADFFRITRESLEGLDEGIDKRVVEAWFLINLSKTSGEEVNLYRDGNGSKLLADMRYSYDVMEKAYLPKENGEYGAEEIKIMRLMTTADLKLVSRVRNLENWIDKILNLLRIMVK